MKYKNYQLLFIYLIVDLCFLNFSIFFTKWLNPAVLFLNCDEIFNYIIVANIAWMLTFFIFPKRNLYLRDGFFNRIKRITIRVFIYTLTTVFILFFVKPENFNRTFFIQFTIACYFFNLFFYLGVYSLLKFRRKKGFHTNRVAIVGLNDTSKSLRQILENNPILGYHFVGYISSKKADNRNLIIGDPQDLREICEKYHIQMIFVTLSMLGSVKRQVDYIRICNELGIRIRLVHENQQWVKSEMNTEFIGHLALINPQHIPLDDLNARIIKRSFDVLFSSMFLLLIFSWLLPILALIIKLSSKGPVFFVQKRTGINNKTFKCIKFRSMELNINADTMQAKVGDARITRIGKFLRSTNIDELPQFINVFLGQMSVVGPRPHMLNHTIQYSKLIDLYKTRHYVKPGVTGWAQVNGFRGETDELWKMEKRVEFDIKYIENWSIWFDIRIIFLTIFDKKTFMNAG